MVYTPSVTHVRHWSIVKTRCDIGLYWKSKFYIGRERVNIFYMPKFLRALSFILVLCPQVDTGYWMWSFQGKIVRRNNVEGFCNFLWRPRPPSLLSTEQQKEIRKNLKKYSAQFESKDKMRMTKASKVSAVEKYYVVPLVNLIKKFKNWHKFLPE